MSVRSTYTYALLDVSPACYAEIKAKLEAAGYQHAFQEDREGDRAAIVIDMHGIALREEQGEDDGVIPAVSRTDIHGNEVTGP